MNDDRDITDADLHSLEQRLRDERPTPTESELQRIRQRATGRRSGGAGRAARTARLAMVSLLTGAFLIGGGGAALAVSGSSGSGSAGAAQYKQVVPSQTPGSGETPQSGTEPSRTESEPNPTEPDRGGVIPTRDRGGDVPTTDRGTSSNPTQQARQAASGGSDGRLPFTGLAAIPLMGLGVIMLGGGLVLRRRRTAEDGLAS